MDYKTTTLIIAIIFFLAVISYTQYLERNIKRKTLQKNLNTKYKRRASFLKHSKNSPEKVLQETDKLARSFLKELYDVKLDKSYPELEQEFKRIKKEDIAGFCKNMTELYYIQEEINLEDIRKAISKIQKIIEIHKISQNYEEDYIDKISKLLRKGFISRIKQKILHHK